ncbi:MAG: response regulator [Sporomusa sp.]|jgi:two-component system chemotaxis response regulator CheY|nr:response regulator [Sporomusa sp.]
MKRVLIVDDAAFMRLALKVMLEKNGFEVVGEAENGAIGVKKYFELQPDITTMDITMPEMTGIEALKTIKQKDPKAKVIMVSAMGQESFVKEAIINGAVHFLVKPLVEENVISTLKKVASM